MTSLAPQRIGIVGCDSSHVDSIVAYVEASRHHRPVMIAALSGGHATRMRALAERTGAQQVTTDEMAALTDGVVICDRDGNTHASLAVPLLECGIPVFVDKPFATRLVCAEAMIDIAELAATLVTSHSPLRNLAEVQAARRAVMARGPLSSLEIFGPADPGSEWGGLHFYGSHHADLACVLAGGEIGRPRLSTSADGIRADVVIGSTRTRLHFRAPSRASHFEIRMRWADAQSRLRLHPDGQLMWPGLSSFLAAIADRRWPIDRVELVRPVQIMEAVVEELRSS